MRNADLALVARAGSPRTLASPDDLVDAGLIAPARRGAIETLSERYAIAIPPALAALIDRGDPADPIARQFVPDPREANVHSAERADPIGDDVHSPVKGVVHRYRDRALIKLVAVCAVYCRFCFRREMVGPATRGLDAAEFAAALAYIAAHPEIWEVVLTGGDPLVLSPRRLADVSAALALIDHIKILRWHTRLPVAAPDRVTDSLARALTGAKGATVYVALHANHPRELTPEARAACRRLIDHGANMVSQSVLLKGVNDDVDTLEALMRAFVETGIKPYYLHHGDLAPGTGHLRTTIAQGQALMRALRQRVSGLAMPTYMLDIPGGYGKVPIGPDFVRQRPDGLYAVTDPAGGAHTYEDSVSPSSP
jgi:lysine 2,3-aminomutase